MGLNFARLGLPPGMGATFFLPRLVGAAKAAELLLTGKTIDAEEALRIGLVNALHEPADLVAAGRALAGDVANNAPRAIAAITRALRKHTARDLDEALEAEAVAQSYEYGSADVAEGVRAAREKRAPSFRGG
jgi:enoyl-CoA hydratase